jgi:hypothetical protein
LVFVGFAWWPWIPSVQIHDNEPSKTFGRPSVDHQRASTGRIRSLVLLAEDVIYQMFFMRPFIGLSG